MGSNRSRQRGIKTHRQDPAEKRREACRVDCKYVWSDRLVVSSLVIALLCVDLLTPSGKILFALDRDKEGNKKDMVVD